MEETLELIEFLCYHPDGIVGFNLAFDWFHLSKLYNVFDHFARRYGRSAVPIGYIDEIAMLEPDARDGLALRPAHACDLMMYARKGPYQSTMDRSDVRIRRVPVQLAARLCDKLNELTDLKDVYFARKKDKTRWSIRESKNKEGELLEDFRDVVLSFAPSSALKALAVDCLGYKTTTKFKDVEVDERYRPREFGYAPFALAGCFLKSKGSRWYQAVSPKNWFRTWPGVIEHHIGHWAYNERAREYAKNDIVYTRDLYRHFLSTPVDGIELTFDDDDSVLACMVGTVRWHGYKVDLDGIRALRKEAIELRKKIPTAPKQVKAFLSEMMTPLEQLALPNTKGVTLESIADWGDHPAARRAKLVLDARHATKEIELYEKLLLAKRFHASFKVIGALSTRMSGADGLNPQGIKRTKIVRSQFTLNWDAEHYQLDGGDFDGFEMSIMDAAYYDPVLHEEVAAGKLHAHWASKYFYPHMSYDEVIESKGKEPDYYTKAKSMVFAIMYFGTEHTLITRGGLGEDVAKEAYRLILEDHPDFTAKRSAVIEQFATMTQPGGLGSAVVWKEPADYIESLFGFRRYFTIENKTCKTLFDLANDPPPEWLDLNIKCRRRDDKVQTVAGAVRSALYGAAFGVQAGNMRAAGNHKIQSTGAQATKRLERNIWEIQPVGVAPFLVCPMQIHDEVMSVNRRDVAPRVKQVVEDTIADLQKYIPLVKMGWGQNLENWAGKG